MASCRASGAGLVRTCSMGVVCFGGLRVAIVVVVRCVGMRLIMGKAGDEALGSKRGKLCAKSRIGKRVKYHNGSLVVISRGLRIGTVIFTQKANTPSL